MKKNIIIILSIITLIIVSLVIGCKKDSLLNPNSGMEGPLKIAVSTELNRLYNQLQIPDFGNIRLVNGDILKFVSSYVECYHRGTYYKFNAETGALMN